jgi:hypothetical protein
MSMRRMAADKCVWGVVLQGDIETMKSSDIVRRAYLGG